MSESADDLQRRKIAQAILTICASKFGGIESLSVHLGVRENDLLQWIGGQTAPPIQVVEKAIAPFLSLTKR